MTQCSSFEILIKKRTKSIITKEACMIELRASKMEE